MSQQLSPFAQAVLQAYWKAEEESQQQGVGAALRAAALHLHSEEYETCGGASYALMIEQEDLLALAAELEVL